MSSQRAFSPEGPASDNLEDELDQLLLEKPLNAHKILLLEPNPEENSEYISIVLNQLSILITTVDKNTVASHLDQIRQILDAEHSHHIIHAFFYRKLVKTYLGQNPNRQPYSAFDSLLRAELDILCKDCNYLDFFIRELAAALPEPVTDELFRVVRYLEIDTVLAFTLLSRIADPESPEVIAFFKEVTPKVSSLAFERISFTDKSWYHVLLDCALKSPSFPFLHKLSVIAHFNAFDLNIPPVQDFFRQVLQMSFRELLMQIGPENLLPEKLLPSILQIKPEDVDDSIALILAEVLIPGSQNLSPTNGGVTALTFVNNLPEANAKGAQLQTSLKTIDANANVLLNWVNVFDKVQSLLLDAARRNSQPSIASITQLFSALDYKPGLIDLFLTQEWWFEKTLLYILQSMYTQNGAFDLMNSKNLKVCYEGEVTTEQEILKFLYIAMLEVKVMANVASPQRSPQSEGDKKIDSWLTQFFDLHCRLDPHHIIAGALACPKKTNFMYEKIDVLFTYMLDRPLMAQNLRQLASAFTSLKDFNAQAAASQLIKYYTLRSTPEALTKVTVVATSFDHFKDVIIEAKKQSYDTFTKIVIEASNFGVDSKAVLEAELKSANGAAKSQIHLALLDSLESRASQDFEQGQQLQQQRQAQNALGAKPLKVANVFLLLNLLKGSQGLVDPERLKNLQLSLLTTYPRLINFGTGHDAAIIANEEANSNFFPTQVEQEMKNYYSKMYNKDMDIKEIVDMLTRMKTSDKPHEQDVFACMIHSLIDEYRFFAEYPLTALASTSLLFGALLQKDLIQGTTLTVALNFIWESCNQPQDSHMFKFAVQSLYNFKSRLHEYPIYCKHLLKCQSLSAHAKMYQIVKDASNGIPCPDSSVQQTQAQEQLHNSKPEVVAVVYNSIPAVKKTVGLVAQHDPDEAVSDKLLFFVNNMTADNMKSKLANIEGLLTENYFAWFANYLVGERAKTEPNNHLLYANLVFAVENAIFYEYVLNTTLFEVDKLLKHFKDTSTERMQLKNLGAWLGKITLAHDLPLKRDQVALKYLLVEAFDYKTLHVVIPFVCKILEQASLSKVFKVPNPWVLGIIKVLAELYECADLKLNLKFEIEVLLAAFKLKVKDIEPSTIIRTHNPKPEALAAMFGVRPEVSLTDMANLSLDGADPSMQMLLQMQQQAAMMQHQQHQQQQQQQQQHQQQQQQQQPMSQLHRLQQNRQLEEQTAKAPPTNQLDASFSNLVGNSIFTQNPNLLRAFQASLARAVRECAVPILSRVSEAVLTTTEALIRKDFATEANVANFRKSYQILAQKLAHSMVVCSGRKILTETIEATMLQLLGNQLNPNELPLNELNLAIQSNVDLCVEIVEKLAASNISELIEERMRPQVLLRERHTPGTPFIDESVPNYALQLPSPLGLQMEGLLESQLRIYTAFGSNSFASRNDAPLASQSDTLSQSQMQQNPQNLRAQQSLMPEQGQQVPNLGQQQQQQQGSFGQAQRRLQPPVSTPQPLNVAAIGQEPLRNNALKENLTPVQSNAMLQQDGTSSVDQLFGVIILLCDRALQSLSGTTKTSLSELGAEHPILHALSQVLSLCQSNSLKHPELLLKVAQYAVNCLFTQLHKNPMSNEIYVVLLDKLCESSPSTAKDVIWWMVHSVDQRKFNMPVIFSLMKVQLVSPLMLDGSIGKLIAESGSPMLVEFATSLLLNVFTSNTIRPIALRSEFACTLEALMNYNPEDTEERKESRAQRDMLFELLNKENTPNSAAAEKKELEAYNQLGYIYVEWVKLLGHSDNSFELQNLFVNRLYNCGILTDPVKFKSFFKSAIDISTAAFVTEQEIRSRTQRDVYLSVDCLAILTVRILLRFSKSQVPEAVEYFKNILGVIVVLLTQEHENLRYAWSERAYFKFFSSLMCTWCDASALDANATRNLDVQFYSVLGEFLNSIQPLIYAGFTFAWISLIAHRMYLPNLLDLPDKAGYLVAVKLLTSLLKFQNVYSKDKYVHHDVISVVFKAINRIFAALAHDQPQFLIDCHYQLATAIPSGYIQVKNIVLAATPKGLEVPSPYALNIPQDALFQSALVPEVHYNPMDDLVKVGLKKPVENFLRIPAPALMRSIYGGMKLNHPKEVSELGFDTVHFNVKLVNALVLHVGVSAAEEMPSRTFNAKSSQTTLIVDLLNQGTTEFRYHVIDAMVNQLRYPNIHTQWFMDVLMHIFESGSLWNLPETHLEIQEITTRVLLERHMVNKPHPWGLSCLLTRLLSNEQYEFFKMPFVKNAPAELKVVFDSLARNIKA